MTLDIPGFAEMSSQSQVDRISQLEERCAHLESSVSDLHQKIDQLEGRAPGKHSELRKRFTELAAEWRRTRGHSSKIKDLVMNDAYQRIIGMGEPAIPFILEELERQPGHWSWALTAISGEDPIPPSARGKLVEVAKIWLQWGRDNNYR